MNSVFCRLTLSVLVVGLLKNGLALQCYKCISVQQDSCYYGTTTLPTLKCMTKSAVCVSYQFEVESRAGNSLRTVRGCQSANNGVDICSSLMREIKTSQGDIERGINCYSCNDTLCNNGGNSRLTPTLVLLLIIAFGIVETDWN